MRQNCNVTPASGRSMFSRLVSVPLAGLAFTDADGIPGLALARRPNTIGFEMVLTVQPTLAAGTPTYCMFSKEPGMDSAQVLAAMANTGFGELVAPGEHLVKVLPADIKRLMIVLRGIESDFATEAAVDVHLSIEELIALQGDDCNQRSCQ